MKTLCLLRHAQASRRIDLQDFDRPLAHAGFEAIHRMAEIFRAENLVPGLVLCSAARRARETWEALAAHLPLDAGAQVALDLREELYLASDKRLLMALRAVPDAADAVLVVAHNPGLQRLVTGLTGPASRADALAALRQGYPPAGLAVLTFALERWRDLAPNAGRLERFLHPRGA
jgi:phosphohistidine phosphatase